MSSSDEDYIPPFTSGSRSSARGSYMRQVPVKRSPKMSSNKKNLKKRSSASGKKATPKKRGRKRKSQAIVVGTGSGRKSPPRKRARTAKSKQLTFSPKPRTESRQRLKDIEAIPSALKSKKKAGRPKKYPDNLSAIKKRVMALDKPFNYSPNKTVKKPRNKPFKKSSRNTPLADRIKKMRYGNDDSTLLEFTQEQLDYYLDEFVDNKLEPVYTALESIDKKCSKK